MTKGRKIDWPWVAIYLFSVCACLLLFSCSPQKRLENLLEKHPELAMADTITIHDTVPVPGPVELDTVLKPVYAVPGTEAEARDLVARIKSFYGDSIAVFTNDIKTTVYFHDNGNIGIKSTYTPKKPAVRTRIIRVPYIKYQVVKEEKKTDWTWFLMWFMLGAAAGAVLTAIIVVRMRK